MLSELHDVKRVMHSLAVPVEVLSADQAGQRLGVCGKTVKRWAATGVFTDARPPGKRKTNERKFYADEIDAYRSEGERGVKRVRESLGRL